MQAMETIYEEMKAKLGELTGLTVTDGGDLTLRLYAVAAQLYSLWEQAEFVLRQCFPQTAEGVWLDRHAQVRGMERRAGTRSVGTLRFSVTTAASRDLTVAAGTVCTDSAGNRFETTAAGTIAAGTLFCDVPARAAESGAAGNVPADTVTYMVLAPAGVEAVTNPAALTDGSDGEGDDSLRARVLNSYRKLPNGANMAYYETQALNVDGVAAVKVLPRNRGVGTVDVVIAAENGVPSQTLLDTVADLLESQREICVDLQVLSPATKRVDVTVAVTVDSGYDSAAVLEAVRSAVTAEFTGRLLGQDVLLARLGYLIYQVPGVVNYAITAPVADVTAGTAVLPVLGTLTITEAEE